MSKQLARHIADDLALQPAFAATPRPIIDAVAAATLLALADIECRDDKDGILQVAAGFEHCEECGNWQIDDVLSCDGDQGPDMCEPCRNAYRASPE